MNRSSTTRLVALALALSLSLAGCRREAAPPASAPAIAGDAPALTRVTLLLNWFPEAEHGGYYAASVHGYYAEEGLDVEILPGGPGASVVPRVATGAVDFGVENADHVVLARAGEAAVVALMAPIQTHPRCILVHADSGITNLHDLANVTLAMNPGGAFATYLRQHVPLAGIRIIPYAGNVSQFLADPRLAQQGYSFSEPFLAQRGGANPRALLLADIGFNPYTSCLLTRDAMLTQSPDIAARIVRASIRGWQHYLRDPAATHQHIQSLNPEMDSDVLLFAWQALTPLVLPQGQSPESIGSMTSDRWNTLVRQLADIGLTPPAAVAPNDCYRLDFLPPRAP
jgi:NitT/TauT family transport system substrate-binding protein